MNLRFSCAELETLDGDAFGGIVLHLKIHVA